MYTAKGKGFDMFEAGAFLVFNQELSLILVMDAVMRQLDGNPAKMT